MSAAFQSFVDRVRAELPTVVATTDGPSVAGIWWLDLQLEKVLWLSFEYWPDKGFGLHFHTDEDGYGERPHEWLPTADDAWTRLRGLVAAAADKPTNFTP